MSNLASLKWNIIDIFYLHLPIWIFCSPFTYILDIFLESLKDTHFPLADYLIRFSGHLDIHMFYKFTQAIKICSHCLRKKMLTTLSVFSFGNHCTIWTCSLWHHQLSGTPVMEEAAERLTCYLLLLYFCSDCSQTDRSIENSMIY